MEKIRAEIANLIRSKPDDELIALVMSDDVPVRDVGVMVTKPVVARTNGNGSRKPRQLKPEQSNAISLVLKVISKSTGISATQVADKTKLPRSHVTKAIAELKAQGEVFQGGERRFARYATTQEVANVASIASRNNTRK